MKFAKIGVVGAGTMGQGIAEMLSVKGLDVLVVEQTTEKLNQAFQMIEISLDKQIEKWGITETEKKIILSKIHRAENITELAACDMVIETVIEDLPTKQKIFIELDRICTANAILASNTSTLSLSELAAGTSHPERIIGLHFLHPVAKIQLVEIIRGLQTTEETYLNTREFVEQVIQKRGIQVYEAPGFVTTRLICTLINEAMHTLAEGVATAEDMDTAMRVGYDFHKGPFEMADRFGLDSVYAAMERMFLEFGDTKYRPHFMLKQMVVQGHLGVKTGQGFFRYDKDGDRL
jgi:3-hydroxybutyryl-CoA dehydrogenase